MPKTDSELLQALHALCPGAQWSLSGDDYAGLEWLDEDQARPTASEIEAFALPTVAVPASISDRQFFQQLAIDGIITEDQALASNAAVIPAPLLAIIDQLPANQQFDAKMKVSGATTFLRADPLTIAIGSAYGMTSADIDAFFAAADAL
jgi:hypothetical protein